VRLGVGCGVTQEFRLGLGLGLGGWELEVRVRRLEELGLGVGVRVRVGFRVNLCEYLWVKRSMSLAFARTALEQYKVYLLPRL
jgi:hypothetical protein